MLFRLFQVSFYLKSFRCSIEAIFVSTKNDNFCIFIQVYMRNPENNIESVLKNTLFFFIISNFAVTSVWINLLQIEESKEKDEKKSSRTVFIYTNNELDALEHTSALWSIINDKAKQIFTKNPNHKTLNNAWVGKISFLSISSNIH